MTNPAKNGMEFSTIPDFWQQVRHAPARFLGLDYDGTLAPFALDPMQAAPLPGIADLLRNLTTDPQTMVAIISGRPVDEVLTLLANPPVTVIGNHGFELWPHDDARVVRQPTPEQLQGLFEIRGHLQRRGYGPMLEVKMASLALHTRGLEPVTAVAVEQEVLTEWGAWALRYGLECRWFNGGVEIRCSDWNKGHALSALLALQPDHVFAVYIGDDETDEDAFAVLKNRGIGLKVGQSGKPTAAQDFLPDCAAVADFLRHWLTVTGSTAR
jgi:trehalose-phosphatase